MATGLELIISSICNATFCQPIYDNPRIGSLTSQSAQYINDLVKAVNGKHLKIGTYNNRPLSWVEKAENGSLTGKGVAFALVEILQKKFNFTYEVVVPEYNYEWGGENPVDSLIGLLNNSLIDMAAAFVPRSAYFNKMVLFSYDLDEGVWMMLLRRPKASAAGSGLLAPFTNAVWYLILVAVLSYGPCISLLTKLRSNLIPDGNHYLPLFPSVWFVYGAFIKQGSTVSPEANSTRVLFTTWWLFIILLSAFYTANLTAFLTLSKFTLDVEYPEDLLRKNYRWVASEGGAVQYVVTNHNEDLYYLNSMVTSGRAKFVSLNSDFDYLPLVERGAVLVKEETAIDDMMYADYLKKARKGVEESERCTYVVAPYAFMKKTRAFAYPKGSNIRELFDYAITYILQSGIIHFLERRNLPSATICPLDLLSKDRQLGNSDLVMTYMIMFLGLSAATAVFIGELIIKRYVKIKLIKGGKQKRKKAKYSNKTKIHNFDDSRPPPYESIFGRRSKMKVADTKRSVINGREYFVFHASHGDTRLVPVRSLSAFLYKMDK